MLRRRRLVPWALAYGAGAWLLLQVLSLLSGTYAWPPSYMRVAVGVAVVGFAVAIVIAWFHGERGTQRPPRSELALLAAILIPGAALIWHSESTRQAEDARRAHFAESPGAPAAPPNSIAVLAFENLSDDKDNAYFAEGIAEDLLNRLSSVAGLQVAGRASSFAIQANGAEPADIASRLHVAYLLEGSVRRSGDRVRVTAQLIKAATGFQVWSETFDRNLTDIFAVQDEISTAISDAMKVSLLKSPAGLAQTSAVSITAYDAFLKGQALLATRRTEDLYAARKEFLSALRIAPDYAPALVALARADLLIPMWSQLTGAAVADSLEEAERSAKHALVQDPDNAAAHAVLGTLYGNFLWRWDDAEREFGRALQLAPGNADIQNFAGDFYRTLLDRTRAFAAERRALELDPLAPFNHEDLGWLHLALGEYAKAIERANETRQLGPELADPYFILVWSYGKLKRFPEMREAILQAHDRAQASEPQLLQLHAWAAIFEGRRDDALRILKRLESFVQRREYSSAFLGYTYLMLGRSEDAMRWLEHAYDARDMQLVFQEPLNLEEVARDPVTRPLLEKPGLRGLLELRRKVASP